MTKLIKISALLILVNVVLSAYWLLQGDIHYDVDVSRDFLVMEDIVRNKHLTLLGPRSGAIDGIFHGPLWFYTNLPAFLLGGGDPLAVGWFWFILSVIFLIIVFFVAKKLFDFKTAILSALLLSVNSIINPSIGLKNFYNPYGAVFLFPLFFYLFYSYANNLKVKYLIVSLFLLGLIIQFQMAFGVPILIVVTLYLAGILSKKKKIYHFLSFLILLIPLSSFIIFDIRHDGLQLNALVQFITAKNSLNFLENIINRSQALIFGFYDFFSPGKNIVTFFFAIFSIITLLFLLWKNSNPHFKIYQLFACFFFGFWIISLFFPGGIGNYFWPLLPLMIIVFCSFRLFLRTEIFIISFLLLYIINFYAATIAIADFKTDVNYRGPHSWAFNLQVAKNIYQDAGGDFGYFNYSPDRFAYQQRYALIFANKLFPAVTSYSSTKKPLTYLIEVDPAKDRKDISSLSWRISDIKLERPADQVFKWGFIQVEKYFLTKEEIAAAPNPYILDYLFLR